MLHRLLGKSVRRRVELVAILPVMVAVLLLTALSIHNRLHDASDALDDLGGQSVRYLASRAELPLYSGNLDELRSVIDFSDWPRDVNGLALLDRDQNALISSDEFPWPTYIPDNWHLYQYARKQRYYLQPVVFTHIDVNDYQDQAGPLQSLAGYALIAMDLSETRQLWHNILINAILFALGATLVAALLGRLLANSITAPICRFSHALQALQEGRLDTRVTADTQDELAILADGINNLAESVQEGQKNLQDNVDKATRQLQKAMEDLRHKNLELEQARAVAEQSAQAKGEFLARMSHELRTPLTAISGFLKLLDPDHLGLKERHYCTIIEQSTNLLLKHIDDILAFSRLSSNQVILDNAPFALDEAVASVITQMRHIALEKGMELFIDIRGTVQMGRYGDSFRLHQVIANLVSNALKFTEQGWVEVLIREASSDSVCIEVIDTGPGIRPSRLVDIFNPFAQGDTSTTRRFGGTGLGLPIVKNLVDLMGGDIEVESTVGQGTRFIVTLPLPPCDDVPEPQPADLPIALLLSDAARERQHTHALQRCFSNIRKVLNPDELFLPDVQRCEVLVTNLQLINGRLTPLLEVIFTTWEKPLAVLTTPGLETQYYQQIIELRGDRPLSILSPSGIQDVINGVQQAAAGKQGASHQLGTEPEALANLKFLIAEDNQFSRLLLEELVSRHGGDFTSATNGYEALLHAQEEPYDLLLVDVHMPDLGGEESIRRIRTQGTLNRHTPVIALTADILQQDQQALYEAGADALLFKPLDEQALLKCIIELCHRPDRAEIVEAQAQQETSVALLPRYRAELERLLFLCQQAWQQRDEAELREILHQLLGIAGVFRRPELAEQVKRSHRHLHDGGLGRFAAEIATLEAMIEVEVDAP